MTKTLFLLLIIFSILMAANAVAEEDEERARERYLTPEDKRDASLGREIADGVMVSWLLETESERLQEDYGDAKVTFDTDTVYTLQLAAEIELMDWAALEIVGEAEKDKQWTSQLEEAVVALEWRDWSADLGRLYVPFGEYYSQFIADIAIEMGETRGTNLVLDYNWNEQVEFSTYFVHHDDGRVHRDKKDWGMSFLYQPENLYMQLSLGYLSGVVEDDDDFRELYDSEEKLSDAWIASGLMTAGNAVITVEALQADRNGADLPKRFQRFHGLNVEIGTYWFENLRISARWQKNRGVLSSPIKQIGWGFSWASPYNVALTAEQLWSDYVAHEEMDVLKDRAINVGLVIEF